MRTPAFQRLMTRLALVAMLLLVLMPTAGRLLSARDDAAAGGASAGGVPAGWVELCTVSGLKLVKLAPLAVEAIAAAADTGTSHAGDTHASLGGYDCGYCPLLQAALALTLALLLVDAQARRAPARAPRRASFRHTVTTGSLGSRGPPLAL